VNKHFKAVTSANLSPPGSTPFADTGPNPGEILRIALIDDHQLTRECFIRSAFIIQPLLAITPFPSVNAFLDSQHHSTGLVIYVHHGHGCAGFEELLPVLHHFPPRSVIVLAERISSEVLPFLGEFEKRAAVVMAAEETSLQALVSSLYTIHQGRNNKVFRPL
jgi:hypothetical protein